MYIHLHAFCGEPVRIYRQRLFRLQQMGSSAKETGETSKDNRLKHAQFSYGFSKIILGSLTLLRLQYHHKELRLDTSVKSHLLYICVLSELPKWLLLFCGKRLFVCQKNIFTRLLCQCRTSWKFRNTKIFMIARKRPVVERPWCL